MAKRMEYLKEKQMVWLTVRRMEWPMGWPTVRRMEWPMGRPKDLASDFALAKRMEQLTEKQTG